MRINNGLWLAYREDLWSKQNLNKKPSGIYTIVREPEELVAENAVPVKAREVELDDRVGIYLSKHTEFQGTTNLILMETAEGICDELHNKSPGFLPLTAKGAQMQSSTLSIKPLTWWKGEKE